MRGAPSRAAPRGRTRGRWLAVCLALVASLAATPTDTAQSAPAGPPPAADATTTAAGPPRVVTLAPHLTELVYAAGAGQTLVGTVQASDHPPPARRLPRVGDGLTLDIEALAAARPDIVLAWSPTLLEGQQQRLRALGISVYIIAPQTLADIPRTVQFLGELLGTPDAARLAAAALRAQLAQLRASQEGAPPVRVFIEVGHDPLYTVNGAHIISQAVQWCGGLNIFSQATQEAPQVQAEAVLARRPDLVLAGSPAGEAPSGTTPVMDARLHVPRYSVLADALFRPAPRLLLAAKEICQILAHHRQQMQDDQ